MLEQRFSEIRIVDSNPTEDKNFGKHFQFEIPTHELIVNKYIDRIVYSQTKKRFKESFAVLRSDTVHGPVDNLGILTFENYNYFVTKHLAPNWAQLDDCSFDIL